MNQKIQELLMSGKIEEAMQAAIAEKKRTPYIADAHYDLAYAYQTKKQWMKAYEEYSIARVLNVCGNAESISVEQIDTQKEKALEHIAEELTIGTKEELLEKKTFYRLYGNSR